MMYFLFIPDLQNFELEQNKDLSLQTAQEGLKPESPESV